MVPPRPAPDSAFAEVSELIGEPAAELLMKKLGGTYLYVPSRPGPEHPIALLLGEHLAEQLAARFCRETILIPRGRRTGDRERVIELRRTTGLTVKQIALATGYHVRQVSRILDGEDAKRQIDMF
jgi:hypothetical protein